MPTERWGVDLPLASELPTRPIGVVLHWTGGGHRANPVDLAAYHYVVEFDGQVKSGKWPVAANMRRVAGDTYAMHTGGFNSFRVGISAAGMLDYESRDNVGPRPLTEVQVDRLVELAAYFLDLGDLDPFDPKRLCTHREVWTLHRVKGTRNHLKKDIEFLPFRPDLGKEEVGDYLRLRAAQFMGVDVSPDDPRLLLLDERTPEPEIVDTPVEIISEEPVADIGWWRQVRRRLGI